MISPIEQHCAGLPAPVCSALDREFRSVQKHYLLNEWDDLQVDAGRLAEVVLRVIECKLGDEYTPIDGRSKPNRKRVTNAARNDINLPSAFRSQIPDLTELILDFRNNRNAVHVGDIDVTAIDGVTVYQMVLWLIGEIIRDYSGLGTESIQNILLNFTERPVPIIYRVGGRPIVLNTNLDAKQTILVLLYDADRQVHYRTLFKWSGHSNITRWREQALESLKKDKLIHIHEEEVYLLPGGTKLAEEIIKSSSQNVAHWKA